MLGISGNIATNGGTPVTYEYAGVSLANSGDVVTLFDRQTNLVLRLAYDGSFGFAAGASAELRSPDLDITVGSNWVEATNSWTGNTSGDFGSPGERNQAGNWGGNPGSPDADGDGMDDAWEVLFFGSTNIAPDVDSDGDEVINRDEFIADTVPTNSASVFVIETFVFDGGRTITYTSSSARVYTPQYSTNPVVGVWENLEPAFTGSGGEETSTDTATDPLRAYRIDVAIP